MNELTWQRVLEWEALHHDTCGDPKLLRFMGKPHDLRYLVALTLSSLVMFAHCGITHNGIHPSGCQAQSSK